jgi:hypothetical protein
MLKSSEQEEETMKVFISVLLQLNYKEQKRICNMENLMAFIEAHIHLAFIILTKITGNILTATLPIQHIHTQEIGTPLDQAPIVIEPTQTEVAGVLLHLLHNKTDLHLLPTEVKINVNITLITDQITGLDTNHQEQTMLTILEGHKIQIPDLSTLHFPVFIVMETITLCNVLLSPFKEEKKSYSPEDRNLEEIKDLTLVHHPQPTMLKLQHQEQIQTLLLLQINIQTAITMPLLIWLLQL